MRAWALGAALLLGMSCAFAQKATEGEAHVASAFLSGADPGVLAANVKLGPALRKQLGAETDSRKIYAALVERLGGRAPSVSQLPSAEALRFAVMVGGSSEPLIMVEAGGVALLMQYAAKQNQVVFVEQLK